MHSAKKEKANTLPIGSARLTEPNSKNSTLFQLEPQEAGAS